MSEPAKVIPLSDDPQMGQPPRWNSKFFLRMFLTALCSFVAGMVAFLSYNWFVYARSHIETNNAYIEADVFHVQSRMMGFTKDISAEEGKSVKSGDVLLTLDDTDISVEKSFKDAKLKKAKADFARGKALVASKLISVSDFELLEASLAAATADANGTMLKMKYTQILAPAAGVVAKSYVKSGQFIQPGQNLFTVVSKKKYWIKANYKETQIEKLQPGQEVSIQVDAYPGVNFSGKVEGVYPSSGAVLSLLPPENATGNFTKVVQRVPVKINVDAKPGYEFRPGMSVVTSIDIGKGNGTH